MVVVVTVIEALRAFDLVYIINNGRNGLELLSVLVFDNIVGEASRIGFGSAIAVILLLIALAADHHLRRAHRTRSRCDERRPPPWRMARERRRAWHPVAARSGCTCS